MVTNNCVDQPYQSTKGDLMGGTGGGARPAILGVGSDTKTLIADSSQTTGLNWGPATQSFTPTLVFGGLSTGITYSTQYGQAVQINQLRFFNIILIITNKGSATGNAAIVGLPFGATTQCLITTTAENLTLDAGYTYLMGTALVAEVDFYEYGSANTRQQINDTNFANNTALYVSGVVLSA